MITLKNAYDYYFSLLLCLQWGDRFGLRADQIIIFYLRATVF